MASSIEIRGIEELERRLRAWPRAIIRAQRRAVDRTATQVRRLIVNEIADETTVKKSALNRQIKVTQRSRADRPEAKISITRVPIPITEFRPKTRKRATEVRADISTKAGRGVEVVRKAFKPAGLPRKSIYERVIRGGQRVGRFPIRRAVGPSAALMVQPLLPAIIRKGEQILADQLSEELQKEQRRIDARQ